MSGDRKNAFPSIPTLYLTAMHPLVSNKCLRYQMVQSSEKETNHWHSILHVRLPILIFVYSILCSKTFRMRPLASPGVRPY